MINVFFCHLYFLFSFFTILLYNNFFTLSTIKIKK
uniref:Uncharacterized protein n=1 Tax=Siphoviridae sp. ctHip2 TaxID=2827830 RepID=A0A8S5RW59_9CAUD|nr:MAG TPA: hypothetical protein [Siphoviridae sp. ctHip2]